MIKVPTGQTDIGCLLLGCLGTGCSVFLREYPPSPNAYSKLSGQKYQKFLTGTKDTPPKSQGWEWEEEKETLVDSEGGKKKTTQEKSLEYN